MSSREIKLTNTLSGKKEVLKTRDPSRLTMYSCGPTVYGLIHIGNLRAAITADLFYRYFKKAGFNVVYVRNYTDVDDKIIKRANEEGISAQEVARKYISEVEKDYLVAGLLEPTHKTTVTDHMPEIIAMVSKLIEKGFAYVTSDGEVLYSVEKFEGYGKLSGKKLDELEAGARVSVSEKKTNPHDFALWKPAKPGEPFWESPWGKGRPGWHIECSAMSSKWLGDQIDVHHGGTDLVFPHHENEVAQSEAFSGKAPFVSYWVHNAFLTLSQEKMSKSLGNVFLAREFLTEFSGEVARAMLLSVNYRSMLDFNDELVDQTLTNLSRIYEAKLKAKELTQIRGAISDLRAESLWGEFCAECEKVTREINDSYANDLNTNSALASLFTLIREFNRVVVEPMASATPSAVLGAQALIAVIENEIGSVIGIGLKEPTQGLADISRIRAQRSKVASGGASLSDGQISALVEERNQAKKAKNFKRADEIRNELAVKGVLIKDSPTGSTWEWKG